MVKTVRTVKKNARKTSVSRGKAAKSKAAKKPTKPRASKLDAKLDIIISQQKKVLKNEQKMSTEERKIEALEKKELNLENKTLEEEKKENTTQSGELTELEKLERIEEDIKKEVAPHPLRRITRKDILKGLIGAFIGVVVHFTFTYGVEVAEHISKTRATFLLLLTFLIGAGFLYGTGFRKIEDKSLMWLLPFRMIALYASAIIVTVGTLWFFYPHFFAQADLAYRQIAVVNLSAVIGACTADLIGRE